MVSKRRGVRPRSAATRTSKGHDDISAEIPSVSLRRRPDDLTPREQEVLQSIWAGLTNRALSERLGISAKTGESYRANIMKKLRVSNIAQLLKRAIEKGLLPSPRMVR